MAGVTLDQLKNRMEVLHVACSKCDRKGRYKITGLIAYHGMQMSLLDLAALMNADCLKRDTFTADRCDVYFPNLAPSPSDKK